MRARSLSSLSLSSGLVLVLASGALACRQPSAELELPSGRNVAEPSGLAGPGVIVEAPRGNASPLLLDWTRVDSSLASLVDGPRVRVDYDEMHPWAGAALPLVTLVVFGDYECPYCARFDATLDELLRQYPTQLRVVYRQFPLPMHQHARPAAALALAAQARGQFDAVHHWLYENRGQADRAATTTRLASLGLDPQMLLQEVDAGTHDDRIQDDMAFGQRFAVRGTPAYFINGRPGSGAQPREALDKVIKEELALAERLIAAGSAPEQVWARIMAASAPDPQPAAAAPAAAPAAPAPRLATKLAGLPQRGASKPKIELLMCSDFDCPYCQRSVATLSQLLQDHPKELAVFFRNHPLPMHENARAAHRAAVAADNQGQFWPMFDLLFVDTKKRSEAEIEDMAKQLGLDLKRFRKDIADPKTDARIDAELAFCEQDLGARGTPTFFINGRKLVGAQPLDAFEQIIQEELDGRGPP